MKRGEYEAQFIRTTVTMDVALLRDQKIRVVRVKDSSSLVG